MLAKLRPLPCDEREECLLRGGKLLEPLRHQHRFERGHVYLRVDLGKNLGRREPIDGAGEGAAALLDVCVDGGGIGFDAGAGECFDVFPGRVASHLGARAGEDDLLLQRQVLAGPELLVQGPADFDEAVRLEPLRASVYYDRANARHARGDFRGALADFDEAIRLDPHRCAVYVSRANSLYHMRRLGEATRDYRTAFQLDAELAARTLVGLLVQEPARHDDYLDNCEKHLRRDPSDFISFVRRGLLRLLSGRDAEARDDFAQYLQLRPKGRPQLERMIREAERLRAQQRELREEPLTQRAAASPSRCVAYTESRAARDPLPPGEGGRAAAG